MKIAIINPPWYDDSQPELWGVRAGSRWPHMQRRPGPGQLPRYIPFPFFLGIAATIMKDAGFEVLLVDAVAEDVDRPSLIRRLDDFRPDLIFAETATPSLNGDLGLFRDLRSRNPNIRLVFGGIHDTAMIPGVMAEASVPDYWITGEYDFALLDLVQKLAAGEAVKTVPGLIDGNGVHNAPAAVADVDSLPAPLYESLPIANYCDPVCGLPHPCVQAWLSRGCPFGCTFCVWPQIVYNGTGRYRRRNIDRSLDEVQYLIDNYDCESFYFDDDTANIGEDRMVELSARITSRGLNHYPWGMMARGDCMTERMLDALAGAGMYCVKYGVESISQKLIDACNKNTRIEKLKHAIRYSKKIGIKVHLTFTFGLPGETPETIRETLDFARDVDPESAQFSICTPFPGTRFYYDCKEKGYLITDDWNRYLGSGEAVVETPWLSAKRLQEEYQAAVEEWDTYTAERLRQRQERLLSDLNGRLDSASTWTLAGDRDFAEFLWERGGAQVTRTFNDGTPRDNDCQLVIVSRHDEEKIWRRMKRSEPCEAENALRLFG